MGAERRLASARSERLVPAFLSSPTATDKRVPHPWHFKQQSRACESGLAVILPGRGDRRDGLSRLDASSVAAHWPDFLQFGELGFGFGRSRALSD